MNKEHVNYACKYNIKSEKTMLLTKKQGRELREGLKHGGISKLAALISISPSRCSDIIHGKEPVGDETLAKMFQAKKIVLLDQAHAAQKKKERLNAIFEQSKKLSHI